MTTKATPAQEAETEARKLEQEKREKEAVAFSERQEQLKKTASKRMPRVLDTIALVGGLSVYQPTKEQQEKIVKSLRQAVDEVEKELKSSGEQKGSRFQL